jgi:cyclase
MKIRIIPTLLLQGSGLVKSVKFANWRKIGSLTQALNVYRARDVDELVFLDIDATPSGQGPDLDIIAEVAAATSVPLAIGGGITSVSTAEAVLRIGVEKIVINTAIHVRPALIAELAKSFGSQSVVAAIDVRRSPDGTATCFAHGASQPTNWSPVEWAREVEERGAGEILLSAVDRDGTMQGYDLDLIRTVADSVGIPVIASGGAGNYGHLLDAVSSGGASAVAAASMFHFTELTPDGARRYLSENGIAVRAAWRPYLEADREVASSCRRSRDPGTLR